MVFSFIFSSPPKIALIITIKIIRKKSTKNRKKELAKAEMKRKQSLAEKKRNENKRSREEWLEQLESVSKSARTDNAENEPESGERENRRVPFPGIGN